MNTTQQKVIRNKVGLLRLGEELGNVSRACHVMGYSRDTFYRYKQAAEEGGLEALMEQTRVGQPHFPNRTDPKIEEALVTMATEAPDPRRIARFNRVRRPSLC